MFEVVVWTFDGDVPIELGRIALTDRGDGTFAAVAIEPSPPRRLVYVVKPALAGVWELVTEAARRAGALLSM